MRWRSFIFAAIVLSGARVAMAGGIVQYGGTGGLQWNISNSGSESSQYSAASQTAEDGVSTASLQLHRIQLQLALALQNSSDYQSTLHDVQETYTTYQLCEAALLESIRSTPASIAAGIEIEKLEAQLASARLEAKFAGRDRTDKIEALAHELLLRRSAVSQREAQALYADPTLTSLRYAWLDANAKLVSIQNAFASRLLADPQWRSAKSTLEQARTSLASAAE